MTAPRLGTSVTRDIPSPEGTRRIHPSSVGVLGKIWTRAPPPLTEVLTTSLSSGIEEGLAGWARSNSHGDSGRSLGVLDLLCCVAAPSLAT